MRDIDYAPGPPSAVAVRLPRAALAALRAAAAAGAPCSLTLGGRDGVGVRLFGGRA